MATGPQPARASINGWNADYLEAQYERFCADPASISPDLRAFFQGFDLGNARGARPAAAAVGAPGASEEDSIRFFFAVDDLVHAYRQQGHAAAAVDPFRRARERPAFLSLEHQGLSEADLDRLVGPRIPGLPESATLRDLIARLERTYCRSIGAEIDYVESEPERVWLQQRFETTEGLITLSRGERAHLLRQLMHAEMFEKFLGKRYPGDKRFSLEGSESLIPMLNHLLEHAARLGGQEVMLGMAHRGRLNVLNNVVGKTFEQIFTEFEDTWDADYATGGGDVKYHRGYSGMREFPGGRLLNVALASNPSHLESVNAVVEGRCRAKQDFLGDGERKRIIPVLIHGDAALAGQGCVAEVLNLAYLPGYATGGTIHIVINNLIGFTTSPEDARSSCYCTDIAKLIEAPVFHVNGEDPEAVVSVAQFAVEYRQKFGRDVFIDLFCFRRYGHNEQDEASFTQPLLYSLIAREPGVLKVYAERLRSEGFITQAEVDEIQRGHDRALEAAQSAAKTSPTHPVIQAGAARWSHVRGDYSFDPVETGVPMSVLEEICRQTSRIPEGFSVNPKLKPWLAARAELPRTGKVSYADAETLAYGSLLLEGKAVRLSGQDSRRGTFSHRHAVLRDVQTGQPYIPLNHMRERGEYGGDRAPGTPGADGRPRQAPLWVYDSPLSEVSVLGFEYGYSMYDPDVLVLWEAQFGDFVNGAQVIIDQYLAAGETKWDRWSGVVLLLPHGYEGAGPEHSSARMERFLQLHDRGNIEVVYPSTGAQVFHLLRRQVSRPFRKPLIVMTPKSMLRVPTSTIDELTTGSFREVIDDPRFVGGVPRKGVRRLVLCSGKIYFELAERRDELGRDDIAIVRVEQLAPVHTSLLRAVLDAYPEQAHRLWVQEEPRNAGAYVFMADALRSLGLVQELGYIGRPPSATPAVGSKHRSKIEQETLLEDAIGPKAAKAPAGETKKPRPVSANA